MKYHLTLRDNESGEIIKDLDVYGLFGVYGFSSKLCFDEAFSGQLAFCEADPIRKFLLFCVLKALARDLERDPDIKELWEATGAKNEDFLDRLFTEVMQKYDD